MPALLGYTWKISTQLMSLLHFFLEWLTALAHVSPRPLLGEAPLLWCTSQMPSLSQSSVISPRAGYFCNCRRLRLKVNVPLAVLEYASRFCLGAHPTPPQARSHCQLRAEPVCSSVPSTVLCVYLTLGWKVFGYPSYHLSFIILFHFHIQSPSTPTLGHFLLIQ